MFYSYNNQEPGLLPFRIKLSNGLTRTDPSTFTAEEILDAGYVLSTDKPVVNETQEVTWANGNWVVRNLSDEEIAEKTTQKIAQKWEEVRRQRDLFLSDIDWRFIRYESQTRLGITPSDNIQDLDTYAQALRDITLQEDPFNIIWPTLNA